MIEQAQYRIPATGETWRDTRGNCYPSLFTIVGLSNHHETGEPLVVYCEANWTLGQLPPLHVMPIALFLGVVPDLMMSSVSATQRYRQQFEFWHDRGFDKTCPFIRERIPDLHDFKTHRDSWRHALEIARDHAPPRINETDDRLYWEHEIRAFDHAFTAIEPLVNS